MKFPLSLEHVDESILKIPKAGGTCCVVPPGGDCTSAGADTVTTSNDRSRMLGDACALSVWRRQRRRVVLMVDTPPVTRDQ